MENLSEPLKVIFISPVELKNYAENAVASLGCDEATCISNDESTIIEVADKFIGENCLYIVLTNDLSNSENIALNKLFLTKNKQVLWISIQESIVSVGPWVKYQYSACLACVLNQSKYFKIDFTSPEKDVLNLNSNLNNQLNINLFISPTEKEHRLLKSGVILNYDSNGLSDSYYVLKDPNCSDCSRWLNTPTEVFYS